MSLDNEEKKLLIDFLKNVKNEVEKLKPLFGGLKTETKPEEEPKKQSKEDLIEGRRQKLLDLTNYIERQQIPWTIIERLAALMQLENGCEECHN